jgi:O-antigen/teichoic acid export membrane protein
VGHLFGPALLAVFNTYRTLTRVTMQLTAMFSHSIWPELSRLYGQGGGPAVQRLYSRSAAFCAALAVGLSALIFFAAPLLLQVWTHGAIALQPVLLALMLVYAAVAGLWNVPRVMLLATNQHSGLAAWVVATAALSLAVTAALGDRFGLPGVGAALVLAESAIALICVALAQRVLHAPAAAVAA